MPRQRYEDLGQEAAVPQADLISAVGIIPETLSDISQLNIDWTSVTSDLDTRMITQSTERCFLGAVAAGSHIETSTICSTAISLVSRNNHKGLSKAELHTQLQPGMRPSDEVYGECRILNNILFQVLAHITT